jgi:hypothetical protein
MTQPTNGASAQPPESLPARAPERVRGAAWLWVPATLGAALGAAGGATLLATSQLAALWERGTALWMGAASGGLAGGLVGVAVGAAIWAFFPYKGGKG